MASVVKKNYFSVSKDSTSVSAFLIFCTLCSQKMNQVSEVVFFSSLACTEIVLKQS